MKQVIYFPPISHADACLLSRIFNEHAKLRLGDAARLNDWLKSLIAYAGRCPQCGGLGTVNFEGCSGWDEKCDRCDGKGSIA